SRPAAGSSDQSGPRRRTSPAASAYWPQLDGEPASLHSETPFFISFLRFNIPFRMKRARHQLTTVVASQKVINRAFTCRMPDPPFVSGLQFADVEELAGASRFNKGAEKRLLLFQGYIFSLAPTSRLRS